MMKSVVILYTDLLGNSLHEDSNDPQSGQTGQNWGYGVYVGMGSFWGNML